MAHPDTDAEPLAGPDDQPANAPATEREADIDAAEAALREQLVEGDEPSTPQAEDPQPTGGDEPQGGDSGDQPAGDDDQEAPADGEQKPKADEKPKADAEPPADGDDEDEPEEDPEDNRYHPGARRRIRRLLQSRKRDREVIQQQEQAIDDLRSICQDVSIAPEKAPAVLRLAGAALGKRDPQAIRALGDALVKAGYQPAGGQPAGGPSIDPQALAAAIAEAEDSYDFDKLKSLIRGARADAAAPTAPPAATPTGTAPAPATAGAPAPSASPSSGQWTGALQAADREIVAAVGAERLPQVTQAVMARLKGQLVPGEEAAWPRLLRVAVQAEVERFRQAPQVAPKAPQTVRSATRAADPSPLDQAEANLRRQMVGR